MAGLSTKQVEALRIVLDGGVVRDAPTVGASAHWSVLATHQPLDGRTMWSLLDRKLIALQIERGAVPRYWRRLVVITRDGRMALGLPGVDLDEAMARLRLYLIQHDLRASGSAQNTPSDTIHSTTRMVDGREVTEELRASDIERILDALAGHL